MVDPPAVPGGRRTLTSASNGLAAGFACLAIEFLYFSSNTLVVAPRQGGDFVAFDLVHGDTVQCGALKGDGAAHFAGEDRQAGVGNGRAGVIAVRLGARRDYGQENPVLVGSQVLE